MAGADGVSATSARTTASGWLVECHRGDAAAFHARPPSSPARRQVWVFDVDRPALVLGSTQPDVDVDVDVARRLGVDVVRRRSGGGAVLLDPGTVVWIDVLVPRHDVLWHDDVGHAFAWLGQAWAATLVDLGVPEGSVTVHEGALVRSPASPVVCFAGLGPGEVLVDGAKVVGISQRRTRDVARFQSSLLLGWDPARHRALLAPGLRRALDGDDPAAALAALPVRALRADFADVVAAFITHLPT